MDKFKYLVSIQRSNCTCSLADLEASALTSPMLHPCFGTGEKHLVPNLVVLQVSGIGFGRDLAPNAIALGLPAPCPSPFSDKTLHCPLAFDLPWPFPFPLTFPCRTWHRPLAFDYDWFPFAFAFDLPLPLQDLASPQGSPSASGSYYHCCLVFIIIMFFTRICAIFIITVLTI